ncbi:MULTISPECIES: response regulator [Thermodesulfovibrio]|jgi:PleD family two-component response regulator|uniref:Regulatory components of sensory transduction system n=1 Tax=Thermodesulfovibrio yellowstonii (strain ATCC 51303 / DSM 11347 / YP87) TaxID=289376 RepID=B5YH81_THEYD|nr:MULTISPECIES: response regulator [Thermodesulfovibrio]ACI21488.1 regulatory components of sensory transduction system [Thermodesulfovibrio yellowstonii DSM 11347]MDI6865588.1 response regulator [Thermodesulfovibrio yellowstonii]
MKRGKILLIDDNEVDLHLTKILLEKVGYTVLENQGWLGVTKGIKFLNPDLVLLDVNMPALSGDSLYDLISTYIKAQKIPVLFYSSIDETHLKKLKIMKGVTDYIIKGDIFQLYKKISLYIKKKQQFN